MGSFNCFLKGEEHCPHYEYLQPIVSAMMEAAGLILSSPVYGYNITGAMKAFIDHLCYSWMVHRPNEKMFNKIALVISTIAGAGIGNTLKVMKIPLNFMGVKRIHLFGIAVASASWGNVSEKKKQLIQRKLRQKAVLFYRYIKNRDQLPYRFNTKFLFLIMKRVIMQYKENNPDKTYWKEKGWFSGKKPFQSINHT